MAVISGANDWDPPCGCRCLYSLLCALLAASSTVRIVVLGLPG